MPHFDLFEEIKGIREEMDSMFERFFREPRFGLLEYRAKPASIGEPLREVVEKDNEILINVQLPGVDKKDVVLSITAGHIEIKAEKKHELKVEKNGLHKYERSYSGFYRIIPLPENVKAEEAEAGYENGILKIRLPKEEKAVEKRKVQIK